MVSLNYALEGANGDEILFDHDSYLLNPGFSGFGSAPIQVRIEQSAGDGGVWRHTKRGIREVVLPVTILGIDRAEVQQKLRRLARLVQDANGPTKIKALYSNNTELYLEGHAVSNLDGEWGSSAGQVWRRVVMVFQCPTPYWISAAVETFTVGSPNTGRGLLPQLTKLKLASANAFGSITANNVGDVATFPVWQIYGPITDLLISDGTRSFSFTETVALGEVITVDTFNGTVVDDTDANRYDILGPAPKLFRLEPGISTLTITGTDFTDDTSVVCNYSPRYEAVH